MVLGTATEEQRELIEHQLATEAEEERRKNDTWSKWLFGSLQKEEKAGGTLGIAWNSKDDDTSTASQDGLGVVKAVEEAVQSRATTSRGGMLDQLADNATNAALDSTKTWTGWLRSR